MGNEYSLVSVYKSAEFWDELWKKEKLKRWRRKKMVKNVVLNCDNFPRSGNCFYTHLIQALSSSFSDLNPSVAQMKQAGYKRSTPVLCWILISFVKLFLVLAFKSLRNRRLNWKFKWTKNTKLGTFSKMFTSILNKLYIHKHTGAFHTK